MLKIAKKIPKYLGICINMQELYNKYYFENIEKLKKT